MAFNDLPVRFPYLVGSITRLIYGGPYRERPQGTVGILVARELTKYSHSYLVPIQDFSVPRSITHLDMALKAAITCLAHGVPVYVGCAGGRGRTGLFLSLLVKIVMEPVVATDAVRYVRREFDSHAVETAEQREFVRTYSPDQSMVDHLSGMKRRLLLSRALEALHLSKTPKRLKFTT